MNARVLKEVAKKVAKDFNLLAEHEVVTNEDDCTYSVFTIYFDVPISIYTCMLHDKYCDKDCNEDCNEDCPCKPLLYKIINNMK